MLLSKRIVVTGGTGFFGSHIVNELLARGYKDVMIPVHQMYDLRKYSDVLVMLRSLRPDVIIHAAAHCGGIGLNKEKPAELFYDNAIMGLQLMHEAYLFGVKKFVQLGTICEYPKYANVPFREETLWNGYPEETNAPYGLAKRMLLAQGQAYRQQYGFNVIHLLPVNLYGPGDNFDENSSHVIPALIKKFAEAKKADASKAEVWGTGRVSREFLYVEDAAKAIVAATESYDCSEPVNIGTGAEITIADLATMIADKIDYRGAVVFDGTKPDGQPYRCLDTQKAFLKFGFKAETNLTKGLDKTIEWYYNRRN